MKILVIGDYPIAFSRFATVVSPPPVDLEYVTSGAYDLIVGTLDRLNDLHIVCGHNERKIPVAFYDGAPDPVDRSDLVRNICGTVIKYFKRELLIGQKFATPMPDSFPEGDSCAPWDGERSGVWYPGGSGPWKEIITHELEPLTKSTACALVGAHWPCSGPGERHHYEQNHFWASVAGGLAMVVQRPFIQIPHGPIEGEHFQCADQPDELVDKVRALMKRPDRLAWLAEQSHAWFLEHHTDEKRAQYFLQECGL